MKVISSCSRGAQYTVRVADDQRLHTHVKGIWAAEQSKYHKGGEADAGRPQSFQTFNAAIFYLFLHTGGKTTITMKEQLITLFSLKGLWSHRYKTNDDKTQWVNIKHSADTDMNSTLPAAHHCSVWMNSSNRGHLVPDTLQSAWQQDWVIPLLQHVFLSASSHQHSSLWGQYVSRNIFTNNDQTTSDWAAHRPTSIQITLMSVTLH